MGVNVLSLIRNDAGLVGVVIVECFCGRIIFLVFLFAFIQVFQDAFELSVFEGCVNFVFFILSHYFYGLIVKKRLVYQEIAFN